MIDLLAPIIGNGSTAWNWGYQPWLPFYNFLPIIGLTTLLIIVLVRTQDDVKYASWFLSSSVWALAPTWFYYRLFRTPPIETLLNWLAHGLLLFAVNAWYFMWKKTKVKTDVD